MRYERKEPLKCVCKVCGTAFDSFALKPSQHCSDACRSRTFYARHRSKEIKRMKRWRDQNPEKNRASKHNWYRNNRERALLMHKDWQLRHDFGITLEEYDALCAAQNERCAICAKHCPNRTLRVDHCHKEDKIRELLCDNCNTGIGMFHENPAKLQAAIEYVRKHGSSPTT